MSDKKPKRRKESDSRHSDAERRVNPSPWTREDFFGDLKRATRRLGDERSKERA
jgi:hypothetical protein